MPKAKQTEIIDLTHTGGIWDFVVRDSSQPEEGMIPNFVFENIIGILADDVRQYELVKLKNTVVTESNVKSISNKYGEKYNVGDTFQEWIPLYGNSGCYPGTIAQCMNKIKDIMVANGMSKLKEESDMKKIIELISDLDTRITKCLDTNYKRIKEIE